MMSPGDRLACEVVERASEPLGYLTAVDEKNSGVALANQLKKARMNCVPDGDPARHLGGRTGGDFLHGVEARHILNRNFNSKTQLLDCTCIDDSDWTITQWA